MYRHRENHPDERIRDYTKFFYSHASKYWKAGHLHFNVPEEAAAPDRNFLDRTVGLACNMPDILRGLMAGTAKSVILAQRPDDIGRGSREPDKDDYYGRAPAEIGGFYSSREGLVVALAEQFNRASGAYKKISDPDIVIMHEIFHAFDDITGLSDLPEFHDAWRLDVLAGLHKTGDYGYLLQEDGRGRRETVAESGCKMLMGSCRSGAVDRAFPRSYAFTMAFYQAIEKNFDQDRDFLRHKETGVATVRPEFLHDCAYEAEKATLSGLMHDDQFRNLATLGWRDDDRPCPEPEREKRRIYKEIISRQQEDETARAARIEQADLMLRVIRDMGGRRSPLILIR